jgi:transcription initiation factor TFIIIB Brf1 subunit/transcription initiation factor TFIIB
MICSSCKIDGVVLDSEEYCPKCGLVLNETFFNLQETEGTIRYSKDQLSSMVNNTKKTKDSLGKVLNVSQRNIARKLRNWQKRMKLTTSIERSLYSANLEIEKLGQILFFSKNIKTEILEVYKFLQSKQLTRGKCVAVSICAISYIMVLKHKLAISFDDVVSTTELKKKKVSRVYREYIKELDTTIELPDSTNFINKYIFYGDVDPKMSYDLYILAKQILNITNYIAKMGKGPAAYVSALVYITFKLKEVPIDLKRYMKKAKITAITLNAKLAVILQYIINLPEKEYSQFTTKERLENLFKTINI